MSNSAYKLSAYKLGVAPVASQTFYATLSGQNIMFRLRQLRDAMYIDAKLGKDFLFAGFRCENRRNLLLAKNTPVSGRLYFIDTQGDEDPNYSELGRRFLLVYEV